jgi:LacI family transcriptional regulator
VIGFDNQLLTAAQVRPALTTVALPQYEMGRYAAQLALSQAGEAAAQQVILPCHLVTRKSARRPAPEGDPRSGRSDVPSPRTTRPLPAV